MSDHAVSCCATPKVEGQTTNSGWPQIADEALCRVASARDLSPVRSVGVSPDW